MRSISLIIILFFLLPSFEAWAEPWIGNRFAQNCAGCHAPGRLNRKPKKRRCTLSCQGCHVNPNGGGLRNSYGKWNSERWLRSFYSEMTWSKKSVKPLAEQKYVKENLDPKKKKLYAHRGATLEEFPAVVSNEKNYFESSNYQSAKNKMDEMVRISREDPYRIERRDYVQAGGDFRFFYIKQEIDPDPNSQNTTKLEEGTFFPMVFEVGVRVRPIKENLSFVYEGRALNTNGGTDPSSFDRLFGSTSAFRTTRSAYLMVDDLPYNTYVQYGIYRPMFGLQNPNHNAMIYDYTQFSQYDSTKAIGMGLAPNVPFGMINIIQPIQGAGSAEIQSEDGFVITGGLRFVTMGAHLTASYWSTKNDDAATPRKRVMYDVNAGFVWRRFIFNADVVSIIRTQGSTNEAVVMTAEAKYRIWREFYLQGGYTTANSAKAVNTSGLYPSGLAPGSGKEVAFGTKAFLTSGIEMETLITNKENVEEGYAPLKENTFQMQLHAYF